jgi:hypothetical protein
MNNCPSYNYVGLLSRVGDSSLIQIDKTHQCFLSTACPQGGGIPRDV